MIESSLGSASEPASSRDHHRERGDADSGVALVPVSVALAERHRRANALSNLNEAAANAVTAEEAHLVMEQGRVVAEALRRARQPLEDCWMAGKASVVAARRLVAITTPTNPSLDEGCALIIKALGHIGATELNGGSREKNRARSQAMDLLYEAHDLLRPFVGGYVK